MKRNEPNDYKPSKLTKRLITAACALVVIYGGWYGGRHVTVALVNQGLVIRGLSNRIQVCEANLVKNAKPSKKGVDVIDKDKK